MMIQQRIASLKYALLLIAPLSAGLVACQHLQLSASQSLHLGLGVAQSARPQDAEALLQRAELAFRSEGNLSGQAQAAFALGELYKSKAWQNRLPTSPPDYARASAAFVRAAQLYQQLQQPALAGSAYVGATNAALLADQLSEACQYYQQALRWAAQPSSESAAQAQLNKNLNFFVDLQVVCLAQQGTLVLPAAG